MTTTSDDDERQAYKHCRGWVLVLLAFLVFVAIGAALHYLPCPRTTQEGTASARL